jgi:conjugal transfer mating pair stabilization protein TraG
VIFEVFAYWNIKELGLVFNAVAAIVGGGDYLGLIRTVALVGLLSVAMAVLAGFSQLPDFGRWVIMLALFNAMLLVPKVNVVITDRTGTQPSVTVANVPIGLAAFAHSISHIGDWLTRSFETTFSLPTDIQFRTNGTLFGHRVQEEVLHTKFDNSILTGNLLEFYRECVVPEYSTGFVVASDMAKSNDIWTYLSGKTNPGRLVTIRTIPGVLLPAATDAYGCDVAYTYLTAQIVAVNTLQMNTLGRHLYPGLPTAAANAAVQGAIQTSTNYILGISTTALDATKQAAMSNFMIDAQYMLPAQLGDAASASTNLGQAQAIRSTSESYKMMAKMAESTMPKVKNIVEIVQYSVFPIILLLVLMAGHRGGLVLKAYVMSLVWVQLWPPLYAVMHLVMTMHAQELTAMTSGLGLSMSQYSLLNNAYISDEAIAGMISATAIPAIAAAIVKGGDVGAQAIAGMVTPARESERIASSISSGNLQMGNASLGNQSFDTMSGLQSNTRPTLRQGGFESTAQDGVKRFSGTDVNGNAMQINDASGAVQTLPAKFNFGSKASGALQTASENSERTAFTESVAAREAMTAALNQIVSFEKGHGKSAAVGQQDMTSSQATFIQSYNEAQRIAHNYASSHGLSQKQEAELIASASAEASGGIDILGNGATVSAGASARGKSSSGTTQMQNVAHQLAQDKGFAKAISTMRSAAHQETFTQGEDKTAKAAMAIRSSLDQAKSHEQSAQSAHEKSQNFKEAASRSKEMAGSYEANYTNEFVGWMQTQSDRTGHRYTVDDVTDMALHDKGVLEQYADRFVSEQLVPRIDQVIGKPENSVSQRFDQDKVGVSGTEAPTNFKSQNDSKVRSAASRAGIDPNTAPANQVAGQVQKLTGQARNAIEAGQGDVTKEGKPLEQDATNSTDPTRQNNMSLATQNATAEIMPAGTMSLFNKAGLVSDEAGVAKPVADEYKGTTADAVVDTALGIGSVAISGFGGKVAGAAIGRVLGEGAGKIAAENMIADAGKVESKLATSEVQVVGKAETLESKAAQDAATINKKAAQVHVKTSEEVSKTWTGVGTIGGAVGADQLSVNSSSDGVPLVNHAKESLGQAADAVQQGANKVNDFGNQLGDNAVIAVKQSVNPDENRNSEPSTKR